ncbi:MAG TPA: DUF72 domain-containing protein, partial [Methyloceanibacter sp.]|nr:DUF72 domain-containing protein [Methyloceanibacter sp.]
KLGALLFQLPPNFKKDLAILDTFLADLPPKVCAAFEFRHASWLDEDVFARLAARNLSLCVADSEKMSTPVRVTADYAYFRLRDEGYTPVDIRRWAETIARATESLRDVFVYFKHEEEGKGPEFARLLMQDLGPEPERRPTLLQEVDIDTELVADRHRAREFQLVGPDQDRLSASPARSE